MIVMPLSNSNGIVQNFRGARKSSTRVEDTELSVAPHVKSETEFFLAKNYLAKVSSLSSLSHAKLKRFHYLSFSITYYSKSYLL